MPEQIEAYSAGTEPTVINPRAIDVMSEIGIDISGLMSKSVDDLGESAFDLVITLCGDAQENCPYFPGETEVMHIGFEDPAKATGTEEEIRDIFRRVRDEIRDSIPALLRNRFDSGWRIGS